MPEAALLLKPTIHVLHLMKNSRFCSCSLDVAFVLVCQLSIVHLQPQYCPIVCFVFVGLKLNHRHLVGFTLGFVALGFQMHAHQNTPLKPSWPGPCPLPLPSALTNSCKGDPS